MIKTYKDALFWSLWVLWIVCNLVSALIFKVNTVFVNFAFILLFCILIIVQSSSKKFTNWLITDFEEAKKYKLTDNEIELWKSIEQKASAGLNEYNQQDPSKSYTGAWMSPHLTKEEQKLIDKIHEHFYPGDYIVDPIGASQADYIWYEEIKDKICLKYD